jgi:hypothetical protein
VDRFAQELRDEGLLSLADNGHHARRHCTGSGHRALGRSPAVVMAEDQKLRAARLGLLTAVLLQTAPGYLDWKALHAALSETESSRS